MEDDSNISTVVEILKKLESAGESADEVELLIKGLFSVKVSKNVLKVTGAGKKMSHYSKHKTPSISKIATDLVMKWKKDLQSAMKTSGGQTEVSSVVGKPAPAAKLTPPHNDESTREPQDEHKIEPKQQDLREVDQEYEDEIKQQEAEEDNEDHDQFISDNYTDDSIRQNIRKALIKCLLQIDPKPKKRVQVLSIKIELGLIKAYGKIVKDYSNKSRTVIANLKRSDEFK